MGKGKEVEVSNDDVISLLIEREGVSREEIIGFKVEVLEEPPDEEGSDGTESLGTERLEEEQKEF